MCRLRFGRFLNFVTAVINSENAPKFEQLTEGRFREYWKRTTGNEQERFEEIAEIVEYGIPQGRDAQAEKPGVRLAVIEAMQDGAWYTPRQLTDKLADSLVGVRVVPTCVCGRVVRQRSPPALRPASVFLRELPLRLIIAGNANPVGERTAVSGGRCFPSLALFHREADHHPFGFHVVIVSHAWDSSCMP